MVLVSGLDVCIPYKSLLFTTCDNYPRTVLLDDEGLQLYSVTTSTAKSEFYVVEAINNSAYDLKEIFEYKFGSVLPTSRVYSVLFTNVDLHTKRYSCSVPKSDCIRFYRILEKTVKCK